MKLNWFSPLPPLETGIADYAVSVLQELSKHAEVTAWTSQPAWQLDLPVTRVIQYQSGHVPWDQLNRAELSIYHFGNSTAFHQDIWEVARQHPGILVLHDVRLQHFFAGYYRQDRNAYLETMEKYYGVQGADALKHCLAGRQTLEQLAQEYSLLEHACEGALGTVVHSHEGYDAVVQMQRFSAVHLDLPYTARNLASSRSQKAPPYQLIVFGFLGANRRLNSIFQALATYKHRNLFRLHIVGRIAQQQEMTALVERLGLEEFVTYHGFVPEDRLDALLDQSDLALNLRYPTMGEASASQLRIFAAGLPSLVSHQGWYAALPDDTVAYVRSDTEQEITDIHRHLDAYLQDPGKYIQQGARGYEYLKQCHSTENYVSKLLDFCELVKSRTSQLAGGMLLDRVARDLQAWQGASDLFDACGSIVDRIYEVSPVVEPTRSQAIKAKRSA